MIAAKAARAFLASHRGADPGAVTLVGAGEWSRCFAFTDDGGEQVVRFGRHRDDDWGCSLLGDPLYDVAWLEVWAPRHPGSRFDRRAGRGRRPPGRA